MLGMTERNVQLLAKDRIIPRERRGQYNLFTVASSYIKYLTDRLAGNIVVADQDDLKARKMRAETEEMEAKAELRKIELAEEQAALFRREEIEQQWASRLVEFKSAMQQLPQLVSFRFTDPETRLLVNEEVTVFVHETLERYSREGIIPDRPVGEEAISTVTDSTAKDNSKRMGRQKQSSSAAKRSAGAVANT